MTGAPVLVPVLPNHRFDEAALIADLAAHLPGFAGPADIRQFQGGQSNPTYAIVTPGARYVLRKQPPGKLLPSAHAIDREHAVMSALAGSGVPVPTMRLFRDDPAIIGTPFYVMDYVDGRVFPDLLLRDVPQAHRAAMYNDMARVMAALHRVDWRAAGLESFGRAGGYVARQIDRWTKQYLASGLDDVPAMRHLIDWLPAHVPGDDRTTIVHGDFRLGNLMFHPTEPRIVAVLDWELATLGHPLADVAYNCLPWHTPAAQGGMADAPADGIPDEATYIAAYCRHADLDALPDLGFFLVFSLFRWAAILAGVYRRALDGNAADAQALEIGGRFKALADTGWTLAQKTA